MMFSPVTKLHLYFLLLLSTSTLQLHVQFETMSGPSFDCHGLLPGQCCALVLPSQLRYMASFWSPEFSAESARSWIVNVMNMLADEVAAVWALSNVDISVVNSILNMDNPCSGRAERTLRGPGDFKTYAWDDYARHMSAEGDGSYPPDHYFTGVSYIRLPKTLPIDRRSSSWLAAEGMLSLVWGGGKWMTERGKHTNIPRSEKMRRGRTSMLEGTAYIGPPPRWRFPDLITVNGTDYRSPNTSALYYKSADGQVLDLGFQLNNSRLGT